MNQESQSGWKRKDTRVLHAHSRLKLVEDTVILPDGEEVEYIRFDDYASYPTVIAINEQGKILLTHEYAYPVNKVLTQFPEGSQEEGESLIDAARRELLEETGFVADNYEIIGENLAYHRRTDAKNYIVLATRNVRQAEKPETEKEESGITTEWVTEGELWNMLATGKIIHKNAQAAWALYQAHKLRLGTDKI